MKRNLSIYPISSQSIIINILGRFSPNIFLPIANHLEMVIKYIETQNPAKIHNAKEPIVSMVAIPKLKEKNGSSYE